MVYSSLGVPEEQPGAAPQLIEGTWSRNHGHCPLSFKDLRSEE